MVSLLLAIIYVSFISLGLPDALLGAAWPVMYGELHAPVSGAGLVAMIISAGTIVSSLFSSRLIARLGTGRVTVLSVAMTAAALFGFSLSGSYGMLCLWAVPYGLGAGCVDSALNNFVALHYKASHMSWLHCFWGIGATLGPYIMAFCLTGGWSWHAGYRAVGGLQVVLTAVLLCTLFLWKAVGEQQDNTESSGASRGTGLPAGAVPVLLSFFCYCALEATTGLWASSYMVLNRGLTEEAAAGLASLFYLGITLGRFFSGFLINRLGDRRMVRLGVCLALAGVALLFVPGGTAPLYGGLLCIGLGCAPVFPSMLHATPDHFGAAASQRMMGLQMACAYMGTTFVPPLFGALSGWIGIACYPVFLLLLGGLLTAATQLARVRST